MSKLNEFYKKHIDILIGRNTILFFAIIAHVILLRIFLVPDPFRLELHNSVFSEYKMDTFAPNHLIVESNIWNSKLIILRDGPLERFSLQEKTPKTEIRISLYKANQIYHFIHQLISDKELKKYEDYCCSGGYFGGKLTTRYFGSKSFNLSFPCGQEDKDFDKKLFKLIEKELLNLK